MAHIFIQKIHNNMNKKITNPSTILQFWCGQNATLHLSHGAANTDTKCFQERIRVEVCFVHLEVLSSKQVDLQQQKR